MTVFAVFHIHPSPQSKVSILEVAALWGACLAFPIDQGYSNSNRFVLKTSKFRAVRAGGPDFGRSVYPITTRREDYAHPITHGCSILPAALLIQEFLQYK